MRFSASCIAAWHVSFGFETRVVVQHDLRECQLQLITFLANAVAIIMFLIFDLRTESYILSSPSARASSGYSLFVLCGRGLNFRVAALESLTDPAELYI